MRRGVSIAAVLSLGAIVGIAAPFLIAPPAANAANSNASLTTVLTNIQGPILTPPAWVTAARPHHTVDYTISTHGVVTTDMTTFASEVNSILNDPRGWSQLGLTFQQVPSGGTLSIVLSQDSRVPDFSPECSAGLSCTVGNTVILNDSRWQGATAAWLAVGGTIANYHQMVLSHETGHWLGHAHITCAAPGDPAPVMRANGGVLGTGCTMNEWPLASELWTTRPELQ